MECKCSCNGSALHIGSTPTHFFTFPIKADDIDKILITYMQDGQIVLQKSKDDLEFEEKELDDGSAIIVGSFQFTQEESLLFDGRKPKYCIQVKVKTNAGDVLVSDVRYYDVEPDISKEVL